MGVSSKFKAKVLVAGVASAFALPALAQLPPEILIYGRVNVSVERITVDNSSNTALLPNESNQELVDNSSRIGIRGKKELTPGLAAIFQVESRVKLDDSQGSVFASRDSFAGLQGGFGTIRAGRTIGPVYYATYDYISMHNHDTGTSSDALLAGTVVGNQGFMNNTLWYTSPKFGPFSVDVAYSLLNEARASPGLDQPSHLGLVGAYDQGPLHLAASYATTENTTDLAPGPAVKGDKDTAITVGGLYDFKTFVVGALYEKATSDLLVGDTDRDYFRIAVMMPVAQHEFHVNYGWVDSDATNAGAKQYTLAYNYNITKQTKVYAFYTVVDNESAGTFGFRQSSPAVAGADFSSFALGFRHNF